MKKRKRGLRARSLPWRGRHHNKPRKLKVMIMKRKALYPITSRIVAAICIQSFIRGAIIRNRLRGRVMKKRYLAHRDHLSIIGITEKYLRITGDIDNRMGFQDFCIKKIQAWWRMIMARKQYNKRFPIYRIAADEIAIMWKLYKKRRETKKIKLPEVCVNKIKRFWKRTNNRRIFNYYKNLISFRNMGDPKQMLRAINPKEASLFDPALGIHVRYRLGGHQFPPNIYYKVFTHQPVCDVGAFAPRDYTSGRSNPIHSSDIHNYIHSSDYSSQFGVSSTSIRVGSSVFNATLQETKFNQQEEKKEGWYNRYENNGWRPITIQIMEYLDEDPISKQTRLNPIKFHYSKIKRKEEIEKKRRKKKVDWMKKMYKLGNKKDDNEEYKLVDDVNINNNGESKNDNWEEEVDDLVDWTGSLDYEKYVNDWKSIGTTSGSSNSLQKRNFYMKKILVNK